DRLLDVPRKGVELRPIAAGVTRVLRVGRDAERLEPVVAALHDLRDAGEGLDVVDDRRLAEGAFDGGERRLDPRPGPLSFQALDQPGFFAADVRPGAAVHHHVEIEAAAENVLAEKS